MGWVTEGLLNWERRLWGVIGDFWSGYSCCVTIMT
jgi:hypothetical protein